jgi:hypothetical protein
MEIKILEQTWQLENNHQGIDQLFRQVDELLQVSGYYYTHFEVDGVEIHEDIEASLFDCVENIQEIHVHVSTMRKLADQLLVSTNEYLLRALPEVTKLADVFYQGVGDLAWEKFDQLLEGMDWILHTLSSLQNPQISYSDKLNYLNSEQRLREKILVLLHAVENKDMILIGDLLNYEIVLELQELQVLISTTLVSEVSSYDIS